MKVKVAIFLFLYVLINTVFSCSSHKVKKSESITVQTKKDKDVDSIVHEYEEKTKRFNDGVGKRKMEETYPFSEAHTIRVVSYPDRYFWHFDTIIKAVDGRKGININNELVVDGKIGFDEYRIKSSALLNEREKIKLFNILYNTKCDEWEGAGCYEPRHCVFFYDTKDSIFAHLEFCLGCIGFKGSENVYVGEFCRERVDTLTNFLKSINIKITAGENGN